MDDGIVSNNMDSTLSLMFNKIKPIQSYNLWIKTFWMTPFKHYGFTPSNIMDSPLQTFWMTPFTHSG